MPTEQIPIIKGDTVADNADYRDLLPVNYTAVARKIRGANGYLLTHSGLTDFGTGISTDRGAVWNDNQRIHFRVSGTSLISVSALGATSVLGTIFGTKQVSLANSFTSQAIVADGKMWLFDGTLTQIVDPGVGNPIDITWIDGLYFLTDGDTLYHTNVLDETSFSGSVEETSQFSPDPTLAVDKTSDNQVIVFNRFTIEYYINRGLEGFQFQRVQAKAIKAGIIGTHCETELEEIFYILGGGREEAPSIHRLSPGQYTSIATREVDKIIATYTESELADAVLETRVEDRDRFIIVRLPNDTLLYNATIARALGDEAAWTIIKSSVSGDTKWRGVNGVFDPRVPAWIYGDNQDNRLGRLDNEVATQYGDQIESIFYTPLIDAEAMSINWIELDTLPGHQVSADDTTAAISLTYNGVTYGKEWFALYGQDNDYETRFIANRLGYVRNTIGYKIRVVSPNRTAFSKFEMDYG